MAGYIPIPLKEDIMCSLVKKPNLDKKDMANFRLVSSFPFLGKVIEKMVTLQLQQFLETECLESFSAWLQAWLWL